MRQAVRLADVGDVSLISEPEAAAIHYAIEERVPTGAVVGVYDFGGGTFDATVLRTSAGGFELIGRPEGMERLGGIDFDEAVLRHVLDSVRDAGLEPDAGDPGMLPALARLREECRRAKEALSSDTDTTIAVRCPLRAWTCDSQARARGDDPPTDRRDDLGAGPAVRSAGLDIGALDRSFSWEAARGYRSSARWCARRRPGRSRWTRTQAHHGARCRVLRSVPPDGWPDDGRTGACHAIGDRGGRGPSVLP